MNVCPLCHSSGLSQVRNPYMFECTNCGAVFALMVLRRIKA